MLRSVSMFERSQSCFPESINRNDQALYPLHMQFGSPSDPFLPIEEQRTVAKSLNCDYHEVEHGGHFMVEEFPDLLRVILEKLK